MASELPEDLGFTPQKFFDKWIPVIGVDAELQNYPLTMNQLTICQTIPDVN